MSCTTTTLAELIEISESRKVADPVRSLFGSNFVHDVKQYEQQLSSDGLPLYALHYSDYPKWGLNPKTKYFPRGVYFYFLKSGCDSALSNGFGTDRNYANIGRLNLDKFLLLHDSHPKHFGEEALNSSLQRLRTKYGDDSTEHPVNEFNTRMVDDLTRSPGSVHVLKLVATILGMQRMKLISSFNQGLHDAGFDGILDIDGVLLPIESCQGVQTWPGDSVTFVQALRSPHRREKDGFEARTHNPYPEERLKKVEKYLANLQPGTLRLTDEQVRTVIHSHPKKHQRVDLAMSILSKLDLSGTTGDDNELIDRMMIELRNNVFDLLERNPTTPVWFWDMLAAKGDEDARLAAHDILRQRAEGVAKLSEMLYKDLEEAAVSFGDLSKSTIAMHQFVDEENDRGKVIVLYRPEALSKHIDDMETVANIIVGFIRVMPTDFNPKVWEVRGSAAEKGYGPVLYDIAMSLISPAYLMADRSVVSPDARKIWKFMYDNRINEYDVIDLPPFYRWSNPRPESPNHELPHMDFAYRLKSKLPVYQRMYSKDSKFFAGIDDKDMKRTVLDTLEELAWTYYRDKTGAS